MPVIVVLDTCVLYPTFLRSVLLAVAEAGFFRPLWSPRILEEWAKVAARIGPEAALEAQAQAALMQAAWPKASVPPDAQITARLWLPDPADIHVLSTAITGRAEGILTFNLRDFPKSELTHHDIRAQNPDAFLYELWLRDCDGVEKALGPVLRHSKDQADPETKPRAILKRAKLPKLAKALF